MLRAHTSLVFLPREDAPDEQRRDRFQTNSTFSKSHQQRPGTNKTLIRGANSLPSRSSRVSDHADLRQTDLFDSLGSESWSRRDY